MSSHFATYLAENNTGHLDDYTSYADWTHRRSATVHADGTIDVVDTVNLWHNPENGMHGVRVVRWQTNLDDYGRMVEAAERRFRETNNHNFWHNWQADLEIYNRLTRYAAGMRRNAEILAERPNTPWVHSVTE